MIDEFNLPELTPLQGALLEACRDGWGEEFMERINKLKAQQLVEQEKTDAQD